MNTEQQEARKFLEQKVKESKDITNGLQYLNVSLYDSVAIVMDEFAKSKAKIIAAQPDVIKSVCELREWDGGDETNLCDCGKGDGTCKREQTVF